MKKLELYQCEVCGTQYKSKQECLACETSHIRPVRIGGAKWNAKNVGCSDGLPLKVTIVFENGATAEYKR